MKFNATSIRQHEASKLLTKNFLETGKNILGDGLKLCQRAKAHHTQNPDTAFIVVEKKAVKEKINGKWQTNIYTAVSNLKCNTRTKGNVRKWERDTSTCSQKTE